jgi:hypothetical protein
MSACNTNGASRTRIHPAIDFNGSNAYVGQILPIHGMGSFRNVCLHLIRDDGRIISLGDGETSEIELLHNNFRFQPRWSLQSIQMFSRGETTALDKIQLLEKIKNEFVTYMEFSDERLYDFFALWSIGTYFFQLFNTYPYVYVGGISQSGKSKLLTLCGCISFNAIPSANMSVASIYRLINNARCSLFIDEIEQLAYRHRGGDFRNILLCGYRKGQYAYRNIVTPDRNFTPEPFEVYSPKMLANIEGVEDVLESRCISVTMRRGSNRNITNTEVEENDPKWQQIRDLIYLFLMKNWKEVRQTYSGFENDTALASREWELWKPILSLAKFFDNTDLLERMKNLALEKSEESRRDDSDTHEFILVEVLQSLVKEDGFYRLREIRNEMANRFESSSWLVERYVGRLLRRLGFSDRRRVGCGTEYFFKVSEVTDLAQRLGISEVSERSEDTGERGTQTVYDSVEVTECQEEE